MASRTPRTSDNSGCTAERRISKRAPGTASRGACKTCTHCRQKKVRCDGGRPQCHACIANGQECDYPQDGRRYARASPAKVQSLEAGLAVLWGQMKALGVLRADADLPEVLHSDPHFHGQQQTPGPGPGPDFDELPAPQSLPATNAVASLPVARLLLAPQTGTQTQTHVPCDDGASQWAPPAAGHGVYHGPAQGEQPEPVTHAPHSDINDPTDTMLNEAEPEADKELEETSLSPSEARVAGVSQHDEGRLYVHGLSSILTPNPPPIPIGSRTRRLPVRETSTAAAKARLVSNAALQRQREACLFRGPRNTLDLDGVDVEMARHLLDLHWNRQHYAYLLTYRPAIMDSLAHGGPWANKLLLNAIFYSSCLYSDRPCLRLDPGDPQSAGLRFYTRFRQLLGDAMVESSIPSAVALLLCGATLVSQGRSSAGWALCGTAYRMITDMGVHLTLEPAAAPGDVSSSRNLHSDIEREMRKRLYWGAFITDATQSLYLGRPPALVLAEARVPQLLLDTFEELEDWAPYIDYMAPSPQDALLRSYSPRPAHAVSTFQAMARLFTVSSRMSREIYGIDTVKQPGENLVAARDSIDRQLEQWRSALPAHLRFDPDVDPVVPPHQITPQTTFHVLNIMLLRPFLAEGHLHKHSNDSEKEKMARTCISHAMAIWKLVAAYRKAFTLRRAPFLLSYAVYSAVVVILKRNAPERAHLRDAATFFWTALSELQRGCNFGLQKPLTILRQMMAKLGETGETGETGQTGQMCEALPQAPEPALQDSMLAMLDKHASRGSGGEPPDDLSQMDPSGISADLFDPTMHVDDYGTLDFLDDQERIISDDALYGLFAPPHSLL